jgi:recombination protein RecR
MNPLPEPVLRLIEELAHLPGIGKRSAERMAFHILSSPRDSVMRLALAVRDIKIKLHACQVCFNIAEDDLCPICSDSSRDPSLLCIVELPRDIVSIERSGGYKGLYHVVQGRLSPSDGIGPERLRVQELIDRISESGGKSDSKETDSEEETERSNVLAANEDIFPSLSEDTVDADGGSENAEDGEAAGEGDGFREIILALSPTAEGDATAAFVSDELRKRFPALDITRLARGLSGGAEIENALPSSLASAFQNRHAF